MTDALIDRLTDTSGETPTDTLTAAARATLRAWEPPTPHQDSLRQAYLAFLDAAPNPCERACAPGHLTASAIVFDATGTHVLLTLHPRIGKWVQLGGHCEPGDRDLTAAALREATEESGIDGLTLHPLPAQLHAHGLTCSLGVPTRHLDVRFAAVAPATADGAPPAIICSDESDDLAWWPARALPGNADLDSITELIALALPALRGAGLLPG